MHDEKYIPHNKQKSKYFGPQYMCNEVNVIQSNIEYCRQDKN